MKKSRRFKDICIWFEENQLTTNKEVVQDILNAFCQFHKFKLPVQMRKSGKRQTSFRINELKSKFVIKRWPKFMQFVSVVLEQSEDRSNMAEKPKKTESQAVIDSLISI